MFLSTLTASLLRNIYRSSVVKAKIPRTMVDRGDKSRAAKNIWNVYKSILKKKVASIKAQDY